MMDNFGSVRIKKIANGNIVEDHLSSGMYWIHYQQKINLHGINYQIAENNSDT